MSNLNKLAVAAFVVTWVDTTVDSDEFELLWDQIRVAGAPYRIEDAITQLKAELEVVRARR